MPAALCGRARSLPRRSVRRRGRPLAPGIPSPRLAGSGGAGWGRRSAFPPQEPGGRLTRWATNSRPRRRWAGTGAEMGGASAPKRGPPRLRVLCGAWEAATRETSWECRLDGSGDLPGALHRKFIEWETKKPGGWDDEGEGLVPFSEGTEGFPSLAGTAGGSRPWEGETGSRCSSRPRASSTRLGKFFDLYFPLGQQNGVTLTQKSLTQKSLSLL